MCIDEGLLQARHDGELNAQEAQAVDEHIARCAHCRAAAQQLATRNRRVDTIMAALAARPEELPADARQSLRSFHQQRVAPAAAGTGLLARIWALLTASVRVPVPVAIALVATFALLAAMAARTPSVVVVEKAAVAPPAAQPPQVVIKEKIVTRVIYKERRRERQVPLPRTAPARDSKPDIAIQHTNIDRIYHLAQFGNRNLNIVE